MLVLLDEKYEGDICLTRCKDDEILRRVPEPNVLETRNFCARDEEVMVLVFKASSESSSSYIESDFRDDVNEERNDDFNELCKGVGRDDVREASYV